MAKHKQPHLLMFLIAIIVIFILFGLATFFLTNRRPGQQQRNDFSSQSIYSAMNPAFALKSMTPSDRATLADAFAKAFNSKAVQAAIAQSKQKS